jgi:hypothetical protein
MALVTNTTTIIITKIHLLDLFAQDYPDFPPTAWDKPQVLIAFSSF